MMPTQSLSTASVASRVAAAVLGGYAFVWGFTVLVIALGLTGGLPYDDAKTLAYLLAFLVFLATFCWTFATASLKRVWLVLAAGAALMSLAAWVLLRALG
jgi:hypothetical protein